MKNKHDFTLIEGIFTPEEAKELLGNLISSKINFHKLKNFSSTIRYGKDDKNTTNRILSLQNELKKLESLFTNLKDESTKINISSQIFLSMNED